MKSELWDELLFEQSSIIMTIILYEVTYERLLICNIIWINR